MAGGGSGEKTEKATPKKRKDERKQGNVFSSKDIISVASILVLFSVLKMMFPLMYGRSALFLEKYFDYATTMDSFGVGFASLVLKDGIIECVVMALPLLILSILISVVVTGAQTKFLFSQAAYLLYHLA